MADDSSEKRQRGRPRGFHTAAETSAVQSLDRGLRVLTVVAARDGLSLSEISETAALPASTVYRMLTTLQAHGMVEFDTTAQLWSVGVEAYRTGSAFLRRRKLADRARPFMQKLVDEIGETANLGVAEDEFVVFVGQIESHQAIRAFFRPGSRSPFHASGIGKAMLAFLHGDRVAAVARRAGLEAFTPKTLSTLPALGEDLAQVRRRGWALDDEERHPGMRCVAAPIFNEYGEPVAGISISGPTVRVTVERLAEIGPAVAAVAHSITGEIGGARPDGLSRPG